MNLTTIADTRHTLVFEGLTEHGYILQRSPHQERVLASTLTVTIIADAENNIRPLESRWTAHGTVLLTDGTPGRVSRKKESNNLNGLPPDLRDVVVSAIEDLGVQGTREDLARYATRWQRADTAERARIEAED